MLVACSPPGTGKTSTILACARRLYGKNFQAMVLEVRAPGGAAGRAGGRRAKIAATAAAVAAVPAVVAGLRACVGGRVRRGAAAGV